MKSNKRSKTSGFSLIATMTLMVLLMVMALGMLSLASVSLRTSNSESARQEAEANARLALMIALGELQKAMGPDRRISARALTLANDPRIGGNVSPNTPSSWWIGATGTNPNSGLNPDQPIAPGNPAVQWLISGLKPSDAPGAQLSTIFDKPVDMFAEHSIDPSMTGGQPIQAGITRIDNPSAKHVGGYAWIIDDEGLKAALAPANLKLVNTTAPVTEGDLTAGAYDVSVLDGMDALEGNPLSVYSKILSTSDLSLLAGGDNKLASGKRLSYTTNSRGVLCDVKKGGLKRDLTVAFENNTTFNEVFPRGSGNYTADYLCMDTEKLTASPELQENGYIHWQIFKDYYNIKRHIKTSTDGTKFLDPVRFTKAGFMSQNNGGFEGLPGPADGGDGSLFMAGMLGPHEIGNSQTVKYPQAKGMPYGNYSVYDNTTSGKNHGEFRHSPVIPILQRFQVNAWLQQMPPATAGGPDQLRTHGQVFSSHYNPYNISLYVAGVKSGKPNGGPRILATPKITGQSSISFKVRYYEKISSGGGLYEVYTQNFSQMGFTEQSKYQFHAKKPVMLMPGRSHVLAFESEFDLGSNAQTFDGGLYSDLVKDLTTQYVHRDATTLNSSNNPYKLPASYDMKIRMAFTGASLHHGVEDTSGGGGNHELCQAFWAPCAWDRVNSRPGKVFDLGSVTKDTLNENLMARLGLNLRTTKEAGSSIRPLVDANIRCLMGNTRWDSPLNLPVLAAYSDVDKGEMDAQIMQMSTVDDPKGYTYWGAGRDPSEGFERVILFDIPRADLVSLGQLQHAGAGRFSYEPSYIAGNSYANPRVGQESWKESVTDTFSTDARGLLNYKIGSSFNLYDASYLVNEVIWDGYTFTTIPQVADNASTLKEPPVDDTHFSNLVSGYAMLANARHLPYVPKGSSFDLATLQMPSSKANRTGAFYHNAGHILNDGAFNVNSTSVDAWEAFLSSTHSLPFAKMDGKGQVVSFETTDKVRFPRVMTVFGEGKTKDEMDENFWIGFRELKQTEIRELATAIVDEVKKRGPFLSMADFVNRKLKSSELGKAGALQAALDATVNSNIDSDFGTKDQAAGFPGHLLQGDILQALAPRMTVRSDTFTIRAYGESLSNEGKVLAKAWCEATVQRFPDPIPSGSSSSDPRAELIEPSSEFGRAFRITSFRWLHSDEL